MKNGWTESDEKHQVAVKKLAAIIRENKELKAEVKMLRADRDYWQGIAQAGGQT